MKLIYAAGFLAVFLLSACQNNSGQKLSGNEKPDSAANAYETEPSADAEESGEEKRKAILSTIRTSLDTTLLFDVWVYDIEGPHADFVISRHSFHVVDYDGDGDMPYSLIGNQLTITYPDELRKGEITALTKDTLFLQWDYLDAPAPYVRWNDWVK